MAVIAGVCERKKSPSNEEGLLRKFATNQAWVPEVR